MTGAIVAEPLPAGLDPWTACQRLAGLPHVLFLDSALRHARLGRYSYVTGDPQSWFVWVPNQTTPSPWATLKAWTTSFPHLSATLTHAGAVADGESLPPFIGGLAGLWGYELNATLERLPQPRVNEFAMPPLAVGLYDWVLAWDHSRERGWLISTGWSSEDGAFSPNRAYFRAQQVRRWLDTGLRRLPRGEEPITLGRARTCTGAPGVLSNFSSEEYLSAIKRSVAYIHAGDCFQVNLSQRLVAAAQPPLDLYRRLRTRNAATYAAYFDLGDFQILCSSPECFLRVSPAGEVETRPIKGTRPRRPDPTQDAAVISELQSSPKDRAENVMIVDLLRNDLGRVCSFGSVQVAELCAVESYATVHHLVSSVTGQLRPGQTPLDLLRACFPGGSVTGAPKVRAMEIINELEGTARGAYCGSLGFWSFSGAADTNILIRTITCGRGWLQFPVGGGIVADSDPDAELAETWHKAAGLLRALQP